MIIMNKSDIISTELAEKLGSELESMIETLSSALIYVTIAEDRTGWFDEEEARLKKELATSIMATKELSTILQYQSVNSDHISVESLDQEDVFDEDIPF